MTEPPRLYDPLDLLALALQEAVELEDRVNELEDVLNTIRTAVEMYVDTDNPLKPHLFVQVVDEIMGGLQK